MFMYYLAGVISGVIVTRSYQKDQEKYDTWALITKAVLRGIFYTFCRRLKRKFTDPDIIGTSGVYLRGGNKITWTKDNFERSGHLKTEEIIETMSHGNGKNTFLLDIADKEDRFWRIWVTGRILYSDPVWPFNESVVDEREGVTEAVIEIGKPEDSDHKLYTLTEHFIAIDGPHNNFGSNTNVPIWVALKVMLPHVSCNRLQESDIQVGTIHGSVLVNTKKTLHELHKELVEKEREEMFANDADGEYSDYD